MHFSFSSFHLPIDYLCLGLFSFYLVLFPHLCYSFPHPQIHGCILPPCALLLSLLSVPWPQPGLTGGLCSSALWALKRLITWACGHYLRVARGNVTLLCFCCFRSTFDPGIVPFFPSPHDKHNLISTTSHFLLLSSHLLYSFRSFSKAHFRSPSSCSLAPPGLNWYKWR